MYDVVALYRETDPESKTPVFVDEKRSIGSRIPSRVVIRSGMTSNELTYFKGIFITESRHMASGRTLIFRDMFVTEYLFRRLTGGLWI